MADTGWTFPGTVATASNLAQHLFSSIDNVKLDDGNNASDVGSKFDLTPPGEVSPHDGPELITTNYGFSIPVGATITGVEAKIEGITDTNRVGELAYLTNSGFFGTAKIDEWTDLPTTAPIGIHIYGSSTDLWGATLTPAIVNGTNFGWIFMVYDEVAPLQMNVDYMQIKVHYEESSAAMVIMVGM